MKNYTIVVQNTMDKTFFSNVFSDVEDSNIYYHIRGFVFPVGFADGEYRYYVLPETNKEITVDNDHIYFDGNEVKPLATGLMILGNYVNRSVQYNKKQEYIQYE